MENLKRKSVKAYLLLESLISIALLAFLVSFIVSSLVQVRQKDTEENQKIEALNVAQMAIESHLTELPINGSDIKIKENQNLLIISNHGKEIMQLELQS
ncbi:competence type IV pilus minor pilin ComGE [Lactococcus lactis]|uniref:competence type IV pilus minor pilin ComGE n=1 Tax=Lactococcus lactis TaxID=1358 RepID=UPI00223BB3A7|nr:competence type IV pilus minor pilin ComGE [Lactococcus lactis]MCT1181315.1 competence protein comGE [Lactococcus lactis]